jgi:hypothetical protein
MKGLVEEAAVEIIKFQLGLIFDKMLSILIVYTYAQKLKNEIDKIKYFIKY